MLLEQALGLEPHVKSHFEHICKAKSQQESTAERGVSSRVGRRKSMGVDEGRNSSSLLARKNEGANIR